MNVAGSLVPTLIVLCMGALSGAHALSPHAQFESGVSLEKVMCPDGMILLESPRGTPACVTGQSAERLVQRGFVQVFGIEKELGDLDLVPITADDPTTRVGQDITSSNNMFAVDFYNLISNSSENIFFSPTSIYVAFSALYEGAGGETADQIQQVFRLEPDPDNRHASIDRFMSHLNRDDPNVTLEMANALWIDKKFSVYDTYKDPVQRYYDADVEILDLQSTGEERINGWAKEKTHGIIKEIVSKDSLVGAYMVITNAIYFLGNWTHPFHLDQTTSETFWKNESDGIMADFMQQFNHFDYVRSDGAQILRLPYEGGQFSMMIALPDMRDGIEQLEESITAEMIDGWRQGMRTTEIEVIVPKFKMEAEYDLRMLLPGLGITDVFGYRANLLEVGEPALFVSRSVQKAFVDVDEKGTEAAAVTVIEGTPVGAEFKTPVFLADHPFIFIIQDDESGAILFMGRLSTPPEV